MVGHEKIIGDLKKLADAGELSHGYIFFGPAMVGKKLAARGLAGYLENGLFAEAALLGDSMIIGPNEKGSIGIDESRTIKSFLWQKPNASSRRTVIVDEAELLTTEAQNALLKITEEPPASSLIILVTSDTESILPTILSRLPSIHFGSVSESEIISWLTEPRDMGHGTSDKVLAKLTKVKATEIAKKSFGKPGLAVRLLTDEVLEENIALAEKFLKSPKTTRRDLIKKIIEPDGFDLRKFLDAVIMVLAWEDQKNNAEVWHKALALYERQTNFGLNPRLQLENLLI
jgi:DNA polymerase III delta prime subunit